MKGTSDDSLRLSKVFGVTSMHNSNIATCSGTEGVFYAAGSVAVRYFPLDNEQKGFYQATKAISCMCVSFDGRYLALGERGHLPNVVVWDVVKMEKLVTLSGHKHGVGCIKFSPDDRYLVSVGFKHDKQLIIWDWKTGKKLSTQKLGNKVYSICFHMFGDYFVTGGDRHLKWWTISEVLEGESICIEGKPACIIEEQKTSIFVDIACGSYHCDGKVYCITSTANLCIFNEERMVEKWISLQCKIAYSLELFLQQDSPGLLVVGGANGIIQAFSPKTLELLADMPLPGPLTTPQNANDKVKYPAVYGVRQICGNDKDPIPKLMSFYANHHMQIWDISDLYQIMSTRIIPAHYSCVWDLQCVDTATMNTMNTSVLPHVMNHSNKLPDDTFITCASDNSIRFWNTTIGQGKTVTEKSTVSTTSTATSTVMNPTGDMLHAFQLHADPEEDVMIRNSRLSVAETLASTATGLSMNHEKGGNEFDLAYGIPDLEIPDRIQSTFSPRVIAVHPWGHQMVCGDKSGKLLFYNLQTMELVKTIQAHSAEVLTLAYSSPMITYDDGKTWTVYHHDTDGIEASNPRNTNTIIVLLASAGRDRLIHVFNTIDPQVNVFNTRAIPNIINNLCTYMDPIDTLDHHSSSVTMVKFTHDGKKMISTSGDKTMNVYSIQGMGITKIKTIATPLGTINGMVVDVTNKFLVTSGQDKKITIWNLHNGKPMRSYKHQEYLNTELYKVDLDSSGCYLVTCSFEKQISLIDFFSGEVIAQVMGHSEMITNVKFTPDNMHVISIGGDGCIMLWKMSKLIVRTIKDRLIELYTNAQRKNTRAMIRQNNLQSTATLSSTNAAASPSKQNADSSAAVSVSVPAAVATTSDKTTGPSNEVPKGSLSQLKSKLSVRSSGTSLSTSTTSTSTTNGGSGVKKLNRWEMKLQQEQQEQGGYSLFGKKISAQSNQPTDARDKKLHNKFTLELTSTVLPDVPLNVPSDQFMPPPPPTLQEENSQADDQSMMIGSPNARAVEAEDSVMHALSMSSDEDDDNSMMDDIDGAALIEEVEQAMLDSTIDGHGAIVAANHDDEVMNKSQEKLNDMEKTAKDLENWLEDMIRNETKLDTNIPPLKTSQDPHPAPITTAVVDKPMDLNQSLSSAFFSGLSKRPPSASKKDTTTSTTTTVTTNSAAVAAIPAPTTNNEKDDPLTEEEVFQLINGRKLRESSTMMTQMKERLRIMNEVEDDPREKEKYDTILQESTNTFQTMPPLPPSSNTPAKQGNHHSQGQGIPHHELNSSIHLLQSKTHQYKNVLRELQQAKEKANQSYQELLQLRNSVMISSTSSGFPGISSGANHNHTHAASSLSEAEQLLQEFHSTLTSSIFVPSSTTTAPGGIMPLPTFSSSTYLSNTAGGPSMTTMGSTSQSSIREEDMTHILEKYSDRLLDLVLKKISK